MPEMNSNDRRSKN